MTTPLLPQAFWFRVAVSCRRVDGLPRPRGRLLDLPESCALPEFTRLEGKAPWADMRVAWNPAGLAVAVEVEGKSLSSSRDFEGGDHVALWIDTRDTRDVHRATRFCHLFTAVLAGIDRSSPLDVIVNQGVIHRALASPPAIKPGSIKAQAERLRKGWRLELFFPAETLHGFDPEVNRRLGFAFEVVDSLLGEHYLGVGREFPIAEDPSLWSTLELTEGD